MIDYSREDCIPEDSLDITCDHCNDSLYRQGKIYCGKCFSSLRSEELMLDADRYWRLNDKLIMLTNGHLAFATPIPPPDHCRELPESTTSNFKLSENEYVEIFSTQWLKKLYDGAIVSLWRGGGLNIAINLKYESLLPDHAQLWTHGEKDTIIVTLYNKFWGLLMPLSHDEKEWPE